MKLLAIIVPISTILGYFNQLQEEGLGPRKSSGMKLEICRRRSRFKGTVTVSIHP